MTAEFSALLSAGLLGSLLTVCVLALVFVLCVFMATKLTIQVLMRLTALLATWYAQDKGEKYGGS